MISILYLLTSTCTKLGHRDEIGSLPARPKSARSGIDLVSSYPSILHDGEIFRVRAYQGSFEDDHRLAPILQDGRVPTPTSILRVSPSSTGLDPFFRLPREVSNREKNLLHLCTVSSSVEE